MATTHCHTLSTLVVAALLPVGAWAQDGAPAKILVGFPAGGSFDAIARLVADKVKTELGRPVVVENKTGAGGRIAVDALKASPTDGSVVMLGPDALTSLYPFTFKKLGYDPKKDLVPVGTVAEFAFSFAVGTNPKANTWAEYVAWAKKNPKDANYGIPALGAPHHFYGLVLGEAIGHYLLARVGMAVAPWASFDCAGHEMDGTEPFEPDEVLARTEQDIDAMATIGVSVLFQAIWDKAPLSIILFDPLDTAVPMLDGSLVPWMR